LPAELLAAIDRVGGNRSGFLELAARARLAELERMTHDAHDVEIYQRNAVRLNEEAVDVLAYQTKRFKR
jgi:hypothetical protein